MPIFTTSSCPPSNAGRRVCRFSALPALGVAPAGTTAATAQTPTPTKTPVPKFAPDTFHVGDFGGGGPAITITSMGFADDGKLYGTDNDQLDTIDIGTGAATPVSDGLGVGSNHRAFDCPITVPDVMSRIDPATGSCVPPAFRLRHLRLPPARRHLRHRDRGARIRPVQRRPARHLWDQRPAGGHRCGRRRRRA